MASRISDKQQNNNLNERDYHNRATKVMPDGVAGYSQLRSPQPLYLSHADGSRIFDVNNNSYIDYLLGAGPLILGHRHPAITKAIHSAVDTAIPNVGVSFSQIELAERLRHHVPSMEYLRYLPTGTEAVQAAIRIARKYTGRSLIGKFEGGYHGQSENVMVSVDANPRVRGNGSNPERVPYHCHLPKEIEELTVILPFNDVEACSKIIKTHADQLAVILIEPMLGFAGAIPADKQFIENLRMLTKKHGILLCFDEIITGFRLAMGGGQAHFGINPDLTVLGKAIGGGMPLAAVGGHKNVMDVLSKTNHPDDYVFQSGTFSAFPMSISAGLATLATMEKDNTITHTNKMGDIVRNGLREIAEELDIAAEVTGLGSLFHIHFTTKEIRSARDAEDANQSATLILHERLLNHGIHFFSGRLGFLSGAHGDDDIGYTLNSIKFVLEELRNEGILTRKSK